MITREQIEVALGDDRVVFKNINEDHDVVAISLLRSKIPSDICPEIIIGAEHDVVHLCDVEKSLPYLDENDLAILADCNVWVDEGENYALFV
jgi:hypothetical protein